MTPEWPEPKKIQIYTALLTQSAGDPTAIVLANGLKNEDGTPLEVNWQTITDSTFRAIISHSTANNTAVLITPPTPGFAMGGKSIGGAVEIFTEAATGLDKHLVEIRIYNT